MEPRLYSYNAELQSWTYGSLGGAAVPLLWGAGSPSNTMWPGPTHTSLPMAS